MEKHTYICKLNQKECDLLYRNPHCTSFFCDPSRIKLATLGTERYCQFVYKYSREFNQASVLKESNIPKREINDIFKQKKTFLTLNEIRKHLRSERLAGRLPKDAAKYVQRGQRPSTMLHLGQLKLFLSTLQFLLLHVPKNRKVYIVYPGSAHGYNLTFLSDLFPQCDWILIDPGNFDPRLYKNPKMTVYNCLFTDDLVRKIRKQLKGKHTLLISDIRLNPSEEDIERDNRLQEKWVRILKPTYAQLKFRIPRHLGNTYKYLSGTCYLQIFPPPGSTELRLVVTGNKISNTSYDVEEVEGMMYYYNRVLRTSYYKCNYRHNCMDHCHDCVSMVEHLLKFRKMYPDHPFCKNKSLNQTVEDLLLKIPHVKMRICRDFRNLRKALLKKVTKHTKRYVE